MYKSTQSDSKRHRDMRPQLSIDDMVAAGPYTILDSSKFAIKSDQHLEITAVSSSPKWKPDIVDIQQKHTKAT